MKYIAYVLIAVLVLAASVAGVVANDGKEAVVIPLSEMKAPVVETKDVTIKTAEGEEHVFHVEVAATAQEMEKGLMYRTEMADDEGMIFVFPTSAPRSFWMKNTFIPLDIIYIKKDGTINHIHENAKPQDLTPLPSNGPISRVIEINGGLSEKLRIRAGDVVINEEYFDNKLAE